MLVNDEINICAIALDWNLDGLVPASPTAVVAVYQTKTQNKSAAST